MCTDDNQYSGKLTALSGEKLTTQSCTAYCSIMGRGACKRVSFDPESQSCFIYDKPCTNVNKNCTGCAHWNGKCHMKYYQTETSDDGKTYQLKSLF